MSWNVTIVHRVQANDFYGRGKKNIEKNIDLDEATMRRKKIIRGRVNHCAVPDLVISITQMEK